MERKQIVMLACLGILMLVLAGCQGYKPPKYKSPNSGDDVALDKDLGDAEPVDINVGALDENNNENADLDKVVDNGNKEADNYEPYVEPAATVKETKPKDDNTKYVEATYETIDGKTKDDSKFVKAAYEPLNDKFDDNMPTITVTEGEVVKVNVKATDQDGDSLTYQFGNPLNSEGEWRTRTGDTGLYYSTIVVSDGKDDVEKQVRIVVEPKNNKPTLDVPTNISIEEGETVRLNPSTYDADGDRLTITYSGWMTTNTRTTNYNDAGVHTVKVTVTDGISRVSQDVTVNVKDVNRPPEVEIEL